MAFIALIFVALAPAQAMSETVILALGDSLTAGYGLAKEDSFADRLETALQENGYKVRVINAGVSGDTTAGGLARFDWLIADPPGLVIVELGANDALRGIDPKQTYKNLDAIVIKAKASGADVLLAGMLAPPNLGREYGEQFNAIFPQLAEKHQVPLYPFFLDGVAADPSLNLQDGMHPNADGVTVIVERILPYVRQVLDGATG